MVTTSRGSIVSTTIICSEDTIVDHISCGVGPTSGCVCRLRDGLTTRGSILHEQLIGLSTLPP